MGAWTPRTMKVEAGEWGKGLEVNTLRGLESNILD